MKTVGSRELKNRLGSYLRQVRKGKSFIITDRGEPVARLEAISSPGSHPKTTEEILRELEAAGHLILATEPLRDFKPFPSKGKPASQIILEERE